MVSYGSLLKVTPPSYRSRAAPQPAAPTSSAAAAKPVPSKTVAPVIQGIQAGAVAAPSRAVEPASASSSRWRRMNFAVQAASFSISSFQ